MNARIPPEMYEQNEYELLVNESLLKKYHLDAEVARFNKWSRTITLIMTIDGICYRATDYEEWLKLGMPS